MQPERAGAARDGPRGRGVPGPPLPHPAAAQGNGSAGGGGEVARGPPLSGTSYWLDFWLMILFDLALFVFVYLLP
uniref:Uncharacterized protein n=1 Tax=Anolis carolinensis TaxID=28377 RepID=A0A803T3U5_ANOCA